MRNNNTCPIGEHGTLTNCAELYVCIYAVVCIDLCL